MGSWRDVWEATRDAVMLDAHNTEPPGVARLRNRLPATLFIDMVRCAHRRLTLRLMRISQAA